MNIGLRDLCGYQFGWLELPVLVPISENQIGSGSDFGSDSGTGNRSKTKPNSRTRIKKFENILFLEKKGLKARTNQRLTIS